MVQGVLSFRMSLKYHGLHLVFFICFYNVSGLSENPSIIVIGAGPSGIAAATKLWKNNYTNVKILEAETRIGGRIHSVKFGDAYVDLGGEWCQGEKGNIVYSMVSQYDILKHTDVDIQLYYSNGTLLDQDIFNGLVEFSESIHTSLKNSQIEELCENFSSVGECFDSQYNSTFSKVYQNNSERQTVSLEAKEWLQSYILSTDSAFNLHDSSLKSAYKITEGDMALNWNGKGYKTIFEVMLQQYPDPAQELPLVKNIFLNKEVTKITWNDSDQVSVHCLDKTFYTADHVIFTPSLGVLKADHESLFEPALPKDKVRAIEGIGFGAIMKVIMRFSHTWWNTVQPFAFVWSSEDKGKILSEFGRGPIKDGKSWLTTHLGFITAEQNPRVLIGFFAGEMIPEMEQESVDVLAAGCMYMFRKFLGKTHHNISDPDLTVKTTWYNNPHFRGTYSYDSAKNIEEGLHNKLAAPLRRKSGYPAVIFSGEATHSHHFGTVHGAIESGFDGAERLINFYLKNKT